MAYGTTTTDRDLKYYLFVSHESKMVVGIQYYMMATFLNHLLLNIRSVRDIPVDMVQSFNKTKIEYNLFKSNYQDINIRPMKCKLKFIVLTTRYYKLNSFYN